MSLPKAYSASRAVMFTLALACLLPIGLSAQDQPAPKIEFFGGYSWFTPGANATALKYYPRLHDDRKGWAFSETFYFNRWLGLSADFGGHYGNQYNMSTAQFGPQFKYRTDEVSPFFHVLAGLGRISPAGLPSKNSVAVSVGGGFDLEAGRYVSIRIFEADYQYLTYKNPSYYPGAASRWNGVRVQGGIVFKFAPSKPKLPAVAACTSSPSEIMAGDPVSADVSTSNFNPKRTLSYSWNTTGGTVDGSGTHVTINTAGLAPGDYTVSSTVTDNGRGKKQESASCDTKFTVQEPPKHPPIMSCSAMPATVRAGDPVTVSAQASSPDNRPLSYSWTTSAGRISGSGATVTLDTAGLSAGPVTVNGTVTDDRGLSASCSTGATVEVPPPPPEASKINTIAFPDKRRPARVDNTAKAILDEVALRLQRDADSTAVVVGYASADEVKPKYKRMKAKMTAEELAAQRAVNTKEYLTKEKGIDPSRIKVATGTGDEAKADIWIVPQGATFNEPGTTTVDESVVKPTSEKRVIYHKRVVKKAPAKK